MYVCAQTLSFFRSGIPWGPPNPQAKSWAQLKPFVQKGKTKDISRKFVDYMNKLMSA